MQASTDMSYVQKEVKWYYAEPEKDTSAVEVTAMQEEMEYSREQIVGQEFVASKVTVEEMERKRGAHLQIVWRQH